MIAKRPGLASAIAPGQLSAASAEPIPTPDGGRDQRPDRAQAGPEHRGDAGERQEDEHEGEPPRDAGRPVADAAGVFGAVFRRPQAHPPASCGREADHAAGERAEIEILDPGRNARDDARLQLALLRGIAGVDRRGAHGDVAGDVADPGAERVGDRRGHARCGNRRQHDAADRSRRRLDGQLAAPAERGKKIGERCARQRLIEPGDRDALPEPVAPAGLMRGAGVNQHQVHVGGFRRADEGLDVEQLLGSTRRADRDAVALDAARDERGLALEAGERLRQQSGIDPVDERGA